MNLIFDLSSTSDGARFMVAGFLKKDKIKNQKSLQLLVLKPALSLTF